MANVNRPCGFVPHSHAAGGTIRESICPHTFSTAYAANVFTGDVVMLADTGYVQLATAGATNLLGVFNGCQWFDTDGTVRYSKYWPTGQTVKTGTVPTLFLYDDPNIIYQVQAYTGTLFTQTMVGNNADFISNTAGSTSTGQSGEELDLTSIAATTANFRILGLAPTVDNDSASYRPKVLVRMVETVMQPAGTVGI